MMDKIFSLFGIHRTGLIMTVASQVIKTFEQEFARDGNAKLAAIDALLSILQQHREGEKAIHAAPVAPVLVPPSTNVQAPPSA